jgi:hypothetical protein
MEPDSPLRAAGDAWTRVMQILIGFGLCAGLGAWAGRRLGHPRAGLLAGILLGFVYVVYETAKFARDLGRGV